jgi:hypothetical protein
METKSNTFLISLILAILVSISAFAIVGMLPYFFPQFPPSLLSMIALFGIPTLAYLFSVAFSVMNQYNMCKKVQSKQIFISQLFTALGSFIVSFILFLESLPIYKYIFGPYPPIDPLTGKPLSDYEADSENHYKIQFFSGIVKAVLPAGMDNSIQNGFVYLYWNFFTTLLSSFFLMKMQSC